MAFAAVVSRLAFLRTHDYRRTCLGVFGYSAVASVAAFFGGVIALGAGRLNVLLFGLIGMAVAFMLPVERLLWGLLALAFVVVGQLVYFAKIESAFWLPYFLTLALFLRLPVERLKHLSSDLRRPRGAPPAFFYALFAFFIVVAISAFASKTPPLHLLIGLKNYLFVWSVLFVFAVARLDECSIEGMWRFLLWVAMLQLPLTLVQHLFWSSRNWDAVVGSFNGDSEGGGASGALAVFLVIAMVLALALYKQKQVSPRLAAGVCGAGLVSLLLAEVKVVFILLPLAAMLLFRREFSGRPRIAILGMTIALSITALLFIGYEKMYYGRVASSVTASGYLAHLAKANLRTDFINSSTGEVSRLAVPFVWWRFNAHDWRRVVIGNGVAATRQSSTIGLGEAARRFPFSLDTSTVSVLLWEFGMAGLASFTLVLALGAMSAARLARRVEIPPFHRATLDTSFVALALICCTLIYNRDAVDVAAIQILIALMLGQVAYWHREMRDLDVRATELRIGSRSWR